MGDLGECRLNGAREVAFSARGVQSPSKEQTMTERHISRARILVRAAGVAIGVAALTGSGAACTLLTPVRYISPEEVVRLQQERGSTEGVGESETKLIATKAFELRMDNRIEEARHLLEEAVMTAPEDPNVKFELARMYFYITTITKNN